MPEKVWDSSPEEGEPRFVDVSTAREAIARDPQRYSVDRREVIAEPAPEPAPEPQHDPFQTSDQLSEGEL